MVASSSAYGAIDEIRRGQLAQHIGHMLNVSPQDLHQQMRRLSRRIKTTSAQAAPSEQVLANRAERYILEVLLNAPELFDAAAEHVDPEDFMDAQLRIIAQVIWPLAAEARLALEELLATEAMSNFGSLLTELAQAGNRRENYEQTLAGAVEHLRYRRSRRELQEIKSQGLSDDALRAIQQDSNQGDQRRMPKVT